jgi:glycosyltransferase involved in cell wall biosynthesis
MRVALDGSPLAVETGGIRRYTEQLHAALVREFPADEFEVLAPAAGRWWSFGLPLRLWRGGFDVFHGTDFAVPYLPVRPAVVTLHDLSPWKNEHWRAKSARVRRRTPVLLRLGLATMVITPTQAIRREALARFGLDPARVTAIPLAAAAEFRPCNRPRANYLLIAGTIEPRKNLDLAIEAWRELRRRGSHVELKLVGRNLQGLRPEPGLEILGPVPDPELASLYGRALALLLPSHYEGFGLPMLEAFQCGTPVVASNDAALVEVSGGAAIHPARREWPEAIQAVLVDPAWARRAEARARDFSWASTAHATREVYRDAMIRFGHENALDRGHPG